MVDPTDIVVGLSVETWNDVVRRQFARPPDRLVQYVRSSEDVSQLLVANPWRSVASQLRRRVGPARDSKFPTSRREHLVRPVRLRRADKPDIASLERSYRAYSGIIVARARLHRMQRPALITFNPFLAAFGEHRSFRSVTYVARDDWSAYPPLAHLSNAYLIAYDHIRTNRIRVSAVSQVLMDRIRPAGQSIVVPNGVDPSTWRAKQDRPAELAGIRTPVAMYTGTIDSRLSLPALRAISVGLQGGTVVLVGPRDDAVAAAITREVDNVVLVPSVGQQRLAALVGAADVCVVPHVRSSLTEAMSPLKIYEYLAAGVPVVACDLPPMRGIDSTVRLAGDDSEFARNIVDALAGPRPTEQQRMQFIEQNSWDSRCQAILELALS